MPRLVPFAQCIARPPETGKNFWLKDHLLEVKEAMETSDVFQQPALKVLGGLAGVCHDIVKAHADWQTYIRNPRILKGPEHSAPGAFLFSLLGYQLLQALEAWETGRSYWLWLIRDLADHHGRLKDLGDTGWIRAYDWALLDLPGIENFLKEAFPALTHMELSAAVLDDWLDEIDELLEEAEEELEIGYRKWEPLVLMKVLQERRQLTTSLIAGDRFSIKKTAGVGLNQGDWHAYRNRLQALEEAMPEQPLNAIRLQAQRDILEQLNNCKNNQFFTLEMPTGYGKTIMSLKMAMLFGIEQGYSRIVYVAPYLSILEQTARVMEEKLGASVLQHHSLALLEQGEQRTSENDLAMESWAHSLVCTSFQQFSRALFPVRAQDTLRRAFLQDAVVIIDEPQIFSPDSWNVFLCGLQAAAEKLNLKVIFLSATMPPFMYGLTVTPASLYIPSRPENDRYELLNEKSMDETALADFVNEKQVRTQAVILNTIQDAYRVYQKITDPASVLVHGMMTPLHKKIQISAIQAALHNKKEAITVISTQLLEAGVDVSFQHVTRALAILPSIVQAAGRVNRHGEAEGLGVITVVPFLRDGVRDTRSPIYPESLQRLTDGLLLKKEMWQESEMLPLVQQYYQQMFKQNTYETGLSSIREAYEGNWSELAKFQPFGQDELRLPIFIPWNPAEHQLPFLPKQMQLLQHRFQCYTAEQVYERYSAPHYLRELSFADRKAFMILFRYYVLDLPVKHALKIASKDDFLQQRIPLLFADSSYNQSLGLISIYDEQDNIV